MLTRLGRVGAAAEERERTEPLLYFISHGCSGTPGAWPGKVWLWLVGDSAQDFPVGEAALREKMLSAAGEKFCRVSMPCITAFSQIPSQLLGQLGDHPSLWSWCSRFTCLVPPLCIPEAFPGPWDLSQSPNPGHPTPEAPVATEGLQGCPCPRGGRSSGGSLGAAAAVCSSLINPIKTAPRFSTQSRFVTLSPSHPIPRFPFPTPHTGAQVWLQVELDPGFPLNELPRTVILGVALEFAGFRSF